MILAGIVDQIIIGPFKVDEGVKLNSVNNFNFMEMFLQGTSLSLIVLKWSLYLYMTKLLLSYLKLLMNSLSIKDLQERR